MKRTIANLSLDDLRKIDLSRLSSDELDTYIARMDSLVAQRARKQQRQQEQRRASLAAEQVPTHRMMMTSDGEHGQPPAWNITPYRPLTLDDVRMMTSDEINSRWDEIAPLLAAGRNA
jgi:hypothetical protein